MYTKLLVVNDLLGKDNLKTSFSYPVLPHKSLCLHGVRNIDYYYTHRC